MRDASNERATRSTFHSSSAAFRRDSVRRTPGTGPLHPSSLGFRYPPPSFLGFRYAGEWGGVGRDVGETTRNPRHQRRERLHGGPTERSEERAAHIRSLPAHIILFFHS